MKAAFKIAECSFASAKIRDNKKIRHLFLYYTPFFLQNQNIHRIFAKRICSKANSSQKAILKT